MARETREVWAKRVERWLDSGLTAREFATELGVNPNTLANWRWRLAQESDPPARSNSGTSTPPFVELIAAAAAGDPATTPATATTAPAGFEPLELMLAGGHRLRIPVHFDPGSLRRVLAALEAR